MTMHYNQARFLIVDDESAHRLILKELLKELWAFPGEVIEAETGQEAVSQYQQWQPNLIFMDLQLPDISGYEAIRQIRTIERNNAENPAPESILTVCTKNQNPNFANAKQRQNQGLSVNEVQDVSIPIKTRIIVISASVMERDRTQAFAAGCDSFIKKPYGFHELLETITDHCSYKTTLPNKVSTPIRQTFRAGNMGLLAIA